MVQHLAVVPRQRVVGPDVLHHGKGVGDVQARVVGPVNRNQPLLKQLQKLHGRIDYVGVESHQLLHGADVRAEGGEDLRKARS